VTLNPTDQNIWSKPVREFGKDFTQTGNGTGLLIRFDWLASTSIGVFSTHGVEQANSKRFW
jgi:hypothetical protein